MQEKPYYAHIAQDGRMQTVTEHLRGTALRASTCLASVGLGKTAYLAGLLHDLGKFTAAFQDYLKEGDQSKRGSVIHTFQGCRYLLEMIEDEEDPGKRYSGELMAFAVGAHHGLFDCVDENGKSGMQHREERTDTFYREALEGFFAQEITQNEISQLSVLASNEIAVILSRIDETYEKDDEYYFEIGLLARLLLSAVIEGDRYDTAKFMSSEADADRPGDLRPPWSDRLRFMEGKLAQFSKDTPVDQARAKISDRCRLFAERPRGVYRLNVPTGGGKTLSSLRFALAHAEKNCMKRLIFTSPLLSILEQNAAVIREFVNDDRLILEHHSNMVQTETESERLDERELLIQNWDAPIIITTLVQLLNCMFDGKTASIRRFQALCDSVVVIDEVQTIPTKLLSLFNLTIRFIAEQCGATVILCSATQPYLEGTFHPLIPTPMEIVPYDPLIWNAFARTRLQPMENRKMEELPELVRSLMKDADNLLVVCNKKAEATFLFEQTLSADYISYHLSASMCMQHRRDTVAAMRKSLSSKKTLCVSTQVIEAGVDISFQQVLRLTAGMDSVVQSAGRCNRNGESKTPQLVRLVNCTDETLGKLPDIQRGKTATISLLNAFSYSPSRFHDDLASDDAIEYYYKAFYADMNSNAQDYPLQKLKTTMLDLASENRKFTANGGSELEKYALWQAFKTAGQSFSVFENDTVDILVSYGAGKQLISQLSSERCATDPKYRDSLLKQAASYSVSIYEYQRKQFEACGTLITLCGETVLALQPECYDEAIGLKYDERNLSFLEV